MFRSVRNLSLAVAGLGMMAALAACSGGSSSSTPAMAPHSLAPSSIKAAGPQIGVNTVGVTPPKVLFKFGNHKSVHVFVSPSSDYPFGMTSTCAKIASIRAGLYNEFTVRPLAKNGRCTATFTDEIQMQSVQLPITNHSN